MLVPSPKPVRRPDGGSQGRDALRCANQHAAWTPDRAAAAHMPLHATRRRDATADRSGEGDAAAAVDELDLHAALPAGDREVAVAAELEAVERGARSLHRATGRDADVDAAGDRGGAGAAQEETAGREAA